MEPDPGEGLSRERPCCSLATLNNPKSPAQTTSDIDIQRVWQVSGWGSADSDGGCNTAGLSRSLSVEWALPVRPGHGDRGTWPVLRPTSRVRA
jgi:hypothetical protein